MKLLRGDKMGNFKNAVAGVVSLLAIGLFVAPVSAQDSGQTPDAAAEQPAAAQMPKPLRQMLEDTRPVSELDERTLRQRAKRAQKMLDEADLSQDVRDQLVGIVSAVQAELKARTEAQQQQEQPPAPAPEPAPVEQAQPAPEPAPVEPAPVEPAPVEQAAPAPEPAPVEQAQPAPAPELAPESAPVEQATPEPAPAPEPSVVVEQPAETQAAPEQPKAVDAPPPPAPAAAAEKQQAKELDGNKADPEAEAAAKRYLSDDTAASSLSDDELRKRLDAMRDLMAGNELSRDTERALRRKLKTDREVLRQRIAVAEAAAAEKAAAQAAQAAPAPAPEPAPTEKRAGQTAAAVEAAPQVAPAPAGKRKRNINFNITIGTPPEVIMQDRRDSAELDEFELRRRIEVFRDVDRDRRFASMDDEERGYFRDSVRRDREVLRRRMLDDRKRRRAVLVDEAPTEIDLALDDTEIVVPARRKRDVFVAEVDDQELEEVLTAPPARKLRRKLTLDEIADAPEARKIIPRIEVDTIRFGFNEAFVREEEVDSLDRIAEVIEKILRKYPREVFLIEGHTDAVGSDAYNMKLSKARADAVKKALTVYYVIPARNLQTVGLGERYLKIPTADPEAENRRVSIARATALVGEVEE